MILKNLAPSLDSPSPMVYDSPMTKSSKTNRRSQAPKGRNLATRDMLLYAAQRGQAPTDKASKAYSRTVKHRTRGFEE